MYAQFSHSKYVAYEAKGYATMQITISGNEHRNFAVSVYFETFVSSKFRPRPGTGYKLVYTYVVAYVYVCTRMFRLLCVL